MVDKIDTNEQSKPEVNVKQNDVEQNDDDLSEDFFITGPDVKNKISKPDDDKNVNKSEFNVKGKNIEFSKPYNIKMTIGAELFSNIADFLSEINYDVIFRLFRNKVRLYTVDVGQVYRAHVEFKKTEFADYYIENMDDLGDEEIDVYIDLSVIKNLMISKDNPLDIYIDSLKEMKMYFVCGNDIQWRRMNSLSENDLVLTTFKNEEISLHKLMDMKKFQRIIITSKAMINTLVSMNKKNNKDKESSDIVSIIADKDKFGYVIEDELKGGEYWSRGNDIIVQPIEKCSVELRLEYLKTFGILKLVNQVKILINEKLPMVLETRVGGGNIIIYYLLAPRIDKNE